MAETTTKARYVSVCSECGASIPQGTPIWYDRDAKKVRCRIHPERGAPLPPPPPRALSISLSPALIGEAGSAARREAERWARGADGEVRLAEALEPTAVTAGGVLLHDRAKQRTEANIDHIAVVPSGVYVIDAKHVTGEITLSERELLIGGFSQYRKMLAPAKASADLVRTQVLMATGRPLSVTPVVCLVDGNWAADTLREQRISGVTVCSLAHLRARISVAEGPLSQPQCQALALRLAEAFPAKS